MNTSGPCPDLARYTFVPQARLQRNYAEPEKHSPIKKCRNRVSAEALKKQGVFKNQGGYFLGGGHQLEEATWCLSKSSCLF